MHIKAELFAVGMLIAAGIQRCKICILQVGPVLDQKIFFRQGAAALAGRKGTLQVVDGTLPLGLGGQLTAGEQDASGAGSFRCQNVLRLRGKRPGQQGIHNGKHIAQCIPPIQRLIPQDIKELVHIKNAAGLHHHPVEPAHGH